MCHPLKDHGQEINTPLSGLSCLPLTNSATIKLTSPITHSFLRSPGCSVGLHKSSIEVQVRASVLASASGSSPEHHRCPTGVHGSIHQRSTYRISSVWLISAHGLGVPPVFEGRWWSGWPNHYPLNPDEVDQMRRVGSKCWPDAYVSVWPALRPRLIGLVSSFPAIGKTVSTVPRPTAARRRSRPPRILRAPVGIAINHRPRLTSLLRAQHAELSVAQPLLASPACPKCIPPFQRPESTDAHS